MRLTTRFHGGGTRAEPSCPRVRRPNAVQPPASLPRQAHEHPRGAAGWASRVRRRPDSPARPGGRPLPHRLAGAALLAAAGLLFTLVCAPTARADIVVWSVTMTAQDSGDGAPVVTQTISPAISIAAVSPGVTEGEAAVFELERTGNISGALEVDLAVEISHVGGAPGLVPEDDLLGDGFAPDFMQLQQTVTFPANQRTVRFEFPTGQVFMAVPGPVALLVAAVLPSRTESYQPGEPPEASVLVTAAGVELPVVTPAISIVAVGSKVIEGEAAVFELERPAPDSIELRTESGTTTVTPPGSLPGLAVKVRVDLSDFAPEGEDGIGEAEVRFSEGASIARFELAIPDNDGLQPERRVRVDIVAGEGYQIGDPGSATVTVDDATNIQTVTVSLSEVREGGSVIITAMLGTVAAENLTFAVSMAETTTNPDPQPMDNPEFEGYPSQVTIPAGLDRVTFRLMPRTDGRVEQDETFTVTVGTASNSFTVRDLPRFISFRFPSGQRSNHYPDEDYSDGEGVFGDTDVIAYCLRRTGDLSESYPVEVAKSEYEPEDVPGSFEDISIGATDRITFAEGSDEVCQNSQMQSYYVVYMDGDVGEINRLRDYVYLGVIRPAVPRRFSPGSSPPIELSFEESSNPRSFYRFNYRDDDQAAMATATLEGTENLVVSEKGEQKRFKIRLSHDWDINLRGSVVVGIESSDPDEVTVSPGQLEFFRNTATDLKEVTVAGVDDPIIDGDQRVSLRFTVTQTITSDDEPSEAALPNPYRGLTIEPVVVTNQDDELAVTSIEAMPNPVGETDGATTVTVAFRRPPVSEVTDQAFAITYDGGTAARDIDFTGPDQVVFAQKATNRMDEETGRFDITVIADDEEEADETIVLAVGGRRATIVITDDDREKGRARRTHIAGESLPRFGRTVTGIVMETLGGRLDRRGPETDGLVIGGRQVTKSAANPAAAAASAANDNVFFGPVDVDGRIEMAWGTDAVWGAGPADRTAELSLADLLRGSSLAYHQGADGPGHGWALWGEGARAGFDGRDGDLSVGGTVISGAAGLERVGETWLGGLALFHSRGDGSYDVPAFGETLSDDIEAWLTSVHSYVRYSPDEATMVWGTAGYGRGRMTLSDPTGDHGTDIAMATGAFGASRQVLSQGGSDLAVTSDAFWSRVNSDETEGLDAITGDVYRVRAGLEGGYEHALADGVTLRPSLEMALRHDGGDVETGTGIEVGGAVRYTDPASGLTADAKVRGLVAHEDTDYREWGASGSVRFESGAAGRGLSLKLRSALGADSGGAERRWSHRDAREFVPEGEALERPAQLEAEVGYGFSVLGGRAVATPHAGWSRGEESGTLTLGQRLELGGSKWRLAGELGEDRRSFVAGYDYRLGEALDLFLEARRREAANDEPPEHGVILRARLRW